ncbi:hypothetical protein DPMN_142732 [Dreissena polymorpha]|uniref:Uncharacterized protein n=1 Tax=Dreissena polymorpha TaxID=45954 RepID=A0A9D4GC82_DREPO|nr:hypothetical protein DPMN_142732 [Dreissena polymorpha]
MPCLLGGHVFQPTGIIFVLVQDIIGKNLLTYVHDDRKLNYIIEIILRTKFQEDPTINVVSRGLTRKTSRPLGSHVFQANTNLLTKFHEDWTINVAFTVKMPRPLGGHVFQPTGTIFKLIQDIIETNLLTQVFTRKNAPPHLWPCFKTTGTIFEPFQEINGTYFLTKFHYDRKINVASKVLTRKNAPLPGDHIFQEVPTINVALRGLTSHICKNAPHLGSHVFSSKHWTIHVASRVLTRKIVTPHNGRRKTAITKAHHEHIVLR